MISSIGDYESIQGFEIFGTIPAENGAGVFGVREDAARFPRSWVQPPLAEGQYFDVAYVYVALYGEARRQRKLLADPALVRVEYGDKLYGSRRIADLLRPDVNAGWLCQMRLQPRVPMRVIVTCRPDPLVRVQFGMVGRLWRPIF